MLQRGLLLVRSRFKSPHYLLTLTLLERAGEMAYSYAKGLQEKGVSATVKHFVCQRPLQPT